ncbi:lactate/malate family dehydrogenase [Burkholderia ambifaria]|uniref:lactate/malate family dehydrogenase n=1 Tax=Burkholderia ambifaria TaxID=152480 RepID=UPI001590ECD9|nr:malate dehydrogenase [Burkholderia ambifaria]
MSTPFKRIAVTHAAGSVGRALLRSIAHGDLLGPTRPVALVLMDDAIRASGLRALATELMSCGPSSLVSVEIAIDPCEAFRDADYVIVPDAYPAGTSGMRWLNAEAPLLRAYGLALNAVARRTVKVTIAGDAANTRAWVLRCFTPDLPDDAITGTIRHDYNRILNHLATLCDVAPGAIDGMIVWGKERCSLYPDFRYARIGRRPVQTLLSARHYDRTTLHAHLTRPDASTRNTLRDRRAISDAQAVLTHLRDWIDGSNGAWVSMIVPSDGSYDIPRGLMFSVPVICANGTYERVRALEMDGFSRRRISESVEALLADAFAFRHQFLYRGPMG